MAVHMDDGMAWATRPTDKWAKRVRRIGMRRFGSTSAKMQDGMQPPRRWNLLGKYACGIQGGLGGRQE